MTQNQTEQQDPALEAWLAQASQRYRSIQYAGALAPAAAKPRFRPKPLFALGASLAILGLVWFNLEGIVPRTQPSSTWSQPTSPTSARDLSSLARGVRQGIKPPVELAPRKPQQLQFRIPQRPAPMGKGFAQPDETSGLPQVDTSHLS